MTMGAILRVMNTDGIALSLALAWCPLPVP